MSVDALRTGSRPRAIVGAFTIAAVGMVTYLPALKIQFLDGWWYLEWAAKYPFLRYLVQFFDPAHITQGYRPVQGLYVYLLYQLFGFSPDGYHLVQNLLHAANGVLLFVLVWQLSKRWRLAFFAALIYAVLPNYSLAVFWHAVVDPLAAFFYLLTLLLWVRYMDKPRAANYALAFGAYILALLSKEIAVFLPLFLFLLEWWFYDIRPNWRVHIPRYSPFVLAWVPYLYEVIQVQRHGEFTGQFGFRIGPHMVGNLFPYMAALAFPWTNELPNGAAYYVWLAVVVLLFAGVAIYKRSKALLFLALVAVLNIAPLLGFPIEYFSTRYLYLSTAVTAILFALVLDALWRVAAARKSGRPLVSAAIVLILVVSSASVANAAADLAEYTRQLRVPFHDISLAHPKFPGDSYLYFIYTPRTPLADLQGLFMTRYGLGLAVGGTEEAQVAGLREHANTLVYYFDAQGRPREIAVDRTASTRGNPVLPANFNVPVQLEDYEIVNPVVKHGDPLILILYWKSTGTLDTDYTVFVHLVDSKGEVRVACDSQPRHGTGLTSRWTPGKLIVDAHVCALNGDVSAGRYQLETGMYDAESVQRLIVTGAGDRTLGSKITIQPIEIK